LNIKDILEKYWGYKEFRPLQEEIINSALSGNDTLALLPTGGGKSICFQVPAMAKDGICLVVSPLIALMNDQVENLKKRNISAIAIVSGMTKREVDIALDNCIYGKTKFLYVSPERLVSDIFRERLHKMQVNLIAVDESHCISHWGYDFRPPYLKIAEIRNILPDTPIIALTATATKKVKQDIQEKLLFAKPRVVQGSFQRENLSYSVLYEEDKMKKLLDIITKVGGSGVVYVRSRKQTRKTAEFLVENGVNAGYYHAGLESKTRTEKQDHWTNNKIQVIVSTNAFGMGIDKPDVRFVVHLDIPDSLEAYYQEAGRAGRDGKKAYAVLLYHPSDEMEFEKRLKVNFPTFEKIIYIYNSISNYCQIAIGAGENDSFDFDIKDFCDKHETDMLTTFNCIKILERQGYIGLADEHYRHSRAIILVDNTALYEFQVANKKMDEMIKLMLRSYDGFFNDYVNINENDLANRSACERKEIEGNLKYLDQMKIYLPENRSSQIMFLRPRVDNNRLQEVRIYAEERRKVYKEKMKAMLNYAMAMTKCRSDNKHW